MISKKEYQHLWYMKNRDRLLEKAKNNRLKNKDRCIAATKRWSEMNPDKRRLIYLKSRLKIKYNITADVYFSLLENQSGVCAICFSPETKIINNNKNIAILAVDHDHKTGKIRGLLCKSCNIAIGSMKDSIDRLLSAATYLRERSE